MKSVEIFLLKQQFSILINLIKIIKTIKIIKYNFEFHVSA